MAKTAAERMREYRQRRRGDSGNAARGAPLSSTERSRVRREKLRAIYAGKSVVITTEKELVALRETPSTSILPKLEAAERLMCRVAPHPPANRGGAAADPAEDDVDGDLQQHKPDALITKIKQEPVDDEPEPAPKQTLFANVPHHVTPNTGQTLKNLRKLAPAAAAAPSSLLRTYSKGQQQQVGEGENEFDLFCRSLAVQLKNMPLHRALACQEKLQSVMVQERLAQLRSRSEAVGSASMELPASVTSCFPIVEAMYDE